MDFTREPIIETVITPKEGCKLVVRSSKNGGQEEYFVDAVEVVSFGNASFFRSLERPKCFLVPVTDYEVLEVREARMILKHVGVDRSSIKIGGGRDGGVRSMRDLARENGDKKEEGNGIERMDPFDTQKSSNSEETPSSFDLSTKEKFDKKKGRRQHRRRRGREESEEIPPESDPSAASLPIQEAPPINEPKKRRGRTPYTSKDEQSHLEGPISNHEDVVSSQGKEGNRPISTLLPPPPMLISETIARYKDDVMFKGAFFSKEEQEATNEAAQEERFQEVMQSLVTTEVDFKKDPDGEPKKTIEDPFALLGRDPTQPLITDSMLELPLDFNSEMPLEDIRDDLWDFSEKAPE